MNALKNKKGFTLVEVIVVLVILAILIALLAPSLTGYIDKAKNKGDVVEARQVLIAAQTLASEGYAANNYDKLTAATVKDLAEVPGTITALYLDGGKVIYFTYTAGGGNTVCYKANAVAADNMTDGNYTIGTAPAAPTVAGAITKPI